MMMLRAPVAINRVNALILDTNELFWVSRGIRKPARIPSNLIVVLILADGLESVGCAL
jgi:hypothetical protein